MIGCLGDRTLINTKEFRSNEIKSICCRPHILNLHTFNVSSAGRTFQAYE